MGKIILMLALFLLGACQDSNTTNSTAKNISKQNGNSQSICEADSFRCVAKDIQKCNSLGNNWEFYKECKSDESCNEGKCESCIPKCDGISCGDDGCGGSCGTCSDSKYCENNGSCEDKPQSCGDKKCDPGESCKSCSEDCGECCGDGVCDKNIAENCKSCVSDCGCSGDKECLSAGVCEVKKDPNKCIPDCSNKECGDDECGSSCGTCQSGSSCTNNLCKSSCDTCVAIGETSCTSDGFGYEVCGLDSNSCKVKSKRIPCKETRSCNAGKCGGKCLEPEILLVVDRSSSMLGSKWDNVKSAIYQFLTYFEDDAKVGLRTFPASGSSCVADTVLSLDKGRRYKIWSNLKAPTNDAQTPIYSSLTGIEASFGDPDEAQAVILITDGTETCATEDELLNQVKKLRLSGIKTGVLGVGNGADPALMKKIASFGGLAPSNSEGYYKVGTKGEIRGAINSILEDLGSCCDYRYYRDQDGDGHGDINSYKNACIPPNSYSNKDDDCDDSNASIIQRKYYADTDKDGFGDADNFVEGCSAPAGFVDNDLDCYDKSDSVKNEQCCKKDSDCPSRYVCSSKNYCETAPCIHGSSRHSCPNGLICDKQTQRCRIGCNSDSDCTDQSSCSKTGDDCSDLKICDTGAQECYTICTDSQCSSGKYCSYLFASCSSGCDENADCTNGKKCSYSQNRCGNVCNSDSDCSFSNEVCNKNIGVCEIKY